MLLPADAIPPDVLAICVRLHEAGHQAHLVGGGIRDLLIGREPNDFDVATDALPEAVCKLFGSRFAIPTGLQHGTVTVLTREPPDQRHVEVTTFRGDGAYVDGRRPATVTFSVTLAEDLSRRDFTVNAIAWDPIAAVLTDPFDGRGDLQRKVIRAVGDPVQRFREDGLRVMRAIRQATQLEFTIDPPTLAAIPQTLEVFRMVSMERVRDELLKLLAARKPSMGMELLRETGLLAEILPELMEGVGCAQNSHHRFDVYHHTLAVLDETQGDAILRLGALFHDLGKPRSRQPKPDQPGEFSFHKHEFLSAEMTEEICRRLKLSAAQRELVMAMVTHHMFFYSPEWTDGSVRRFVNRVGVDKLDPLFALREADVAGRGFGEQRDKETRELRQRIDDLSIKDAALTVKALAIDGREVMQALGVPPGRHLGLILSALLERVIDDPALNTRDNLLALLPGIAQTVMANATGKPTP